MILDIIFIRDGNVHKTAVETTLEKDEPVNIGWIILNVGSKSIQNPNGYWTLKELCAKIKSDDMTLKAFREKVYKALNSNRIWVNKVTTWW